MSESSDSSAVLTSPSQLLQRAGRRLFSQTLAVYSGLGPDMGLAFARSLAQLGSYCERIQAGWMLNGLSCVTGPDKVLRWVDISHRTPLVDDPFQAQECLRTKSMDASERELREVVEIRVGPAPLNLSLSEGRKNITTDVLDHTLLGHYRRYAKTSGEPPLAVTHFRCFIHDLLIQGYRLVNLRCEDGSSEQEHVLCVLVRDDRWVVGRVRMQRAIAFTHFYQEQRNLPDEEFMEPA